MKLFPDTGAVAISVEACAALHFDKAAVCLPLHDGWQGHLFATLCGKSIVVWPTCM